MAVVKNTAQEEASTSDSTENGGSSPAAGNSTSEADELSVPALTISTQTQFTAFPCGKEGQLVVNCHIKAAEQPSSSSRKTIDLAVVLDRSGSMSGAKLKLCKDTLSLLVNEMSSSDRLSLISYDDKVAVEFPLTLMDADNKTKIREVIDKIQVGGMTNLSGGLLEGLAQLQKMRPTGLPNEVQSVMILTDGLANVGVTKKAPLCKLLSGYLKDSLENASIFTFGYGNDHDADMLREISEVGRGMYYFVKNIDEVSTAFADCLGGLMSVVAQSMKLNIKVCPIEDAAARKKGAAVKIDKVMTKRPVQEIRRGEEVEVSVGDAYAEEERDILLSIKVPALKEPREDMRLLEFTLTFADLLASSINTVSSTASIQRPTSTNEPLQANPLVLEQYNRIVTAEALERAKELADNGKLEKGRKVIDDAVVLVKKSLVQFPAEEREKSEELVSDMEQCKALFRDTAVYNRTGGKAVNTYAQMHWHQRSNLVRDLDDDAEAEGQSYSTQNANLIIPQGNVCPAQQLSAMTLGAGGGADSCQAQTMFSFGEAERGKVKKSKCKSSYTNAAKISLRKKFGGEE